MPLDDTDTSESSQSAKTSQKSASKGIFSVPAPIRQLFSYFPLLTCPVNTLPIRSPHVRDKHALYIFTTSEGAERGVPSFNPGCLKWQTYLRICGIDFRTVKSNNHASPSGSLPFVLPASSNAPADPVVASRLHKWASGQGKGLQESSDMRYEAYMALIDHRIRQAWLYSLYLTSNFQTVAIPLYILPATSSSIVRLALARELRLAAEAELSKVAIVIDAQTLTKEAEEAFDALEVLLGDNKWFFGGKEPGLIDAALFAYTNPLLEEGLGAGWSNSTLSQAVRSREGLVRHRNRLLEMYY